MKIKTFIIISFVAHAMFLCAIVIAPRLFTDLPACGGGSGIISVDVVGYGDDACSTPSLCKGGKGRVDISTPSNSPLQRGRTATPSDSPPVYRQAGLQRDGDVVSQQINEHVDPASESASVSGSSSGSASGSGEGSGHGSGSGDGVGSGDGRSGGADMTLAKIRRKIESAKRYPMQAKKDGKEGRPEVLFKINPDGSVEYVQLARSSGEDSLDDAAVKTVHSAAPLPFYEKPIRLAIRFTLQ